MSGFVIALFFVWRRTGLMAALSRVRHHPLLAFCLLFVLVFSTVVGMATTNLGSLARYRAPMMPFYGALLMALVPVAGSARRRTTKA
jgi:hypothetical protein